jgi:acyl dehydratase
MDVGCRSSYMDVLVRGPEIHFGREARPLYCRSANERFGLGFKVLAIRETLTVAASITLEQFKGWVGKQLAPTDWFTVDQDRINKFADCTDDHQFIHVDVERAKRELPIGTTIAHGFLSLSLMAGHRPDDFPSISDMAMTLNYGLDRVRFLSQVKSGKRVRIHTKITSIVEKSPGRLLCTQEKTMEIEGESKPAYIAEALSLFVAKGAN